MKRWILLLCCILLTLSTTGCTGENSSSGSSSEPSSSQTQLQEDPETAAALELVAEADCEVPDFLTEEQQTLYRKAYTAYKQFALYTDGFGSTEYNPVTVEEYDNSFYVGNGSITTWKDYETAMLGLFTSDYLEELNLTVTELEDGTTLRYAHFADYQGQLAYSDGARGSNNAYIPPDTFELISRTDDEIRFCVIGSYQDYVENEAGEMVQDGEITQEKYEIVLIHTENGWRFSKFALTI